jgi:DNA adenine methylase
MLNPLKWAGGKRWLVPRLKQLLGHDLAQRRLVIPFCGGLGDALGLLPTRALLNDVNPYLINFYQWWQRGQLALDPAAFQDERTVYYLNRKRFNELILTGQADTAEAAALFFYLNRTGFNGLCRFNRTGGFNVPHGTRSKRLDLEAYAQYVAGTVPADWCFTCGDFALLRAQHYSQENCLADIILCDPPYDGTFADYSQGGFTWADQERLVDWLTPHQGPVILCNAATDRIKKLYQAAGFQISILTAPRSIAGNGDRTPAQEVLAYRCLEQKEVGYDPTKDAVSERDSVTVYHR